MKTAIPFHKYQGTGNDFIIVDNRLNLFSGPRQETVARLCNRRFGIGADGLMLLQLVRGYDFEMVYFNSDGREGSMCGNGGRCIVEFARTLGIIKEKAYFLASDGDHEAIIRKESVSLKMNDVRKIEVAADHCFLNTGSPHYVSFVHDVTSFDVVSEGRKIRNSERFQREGTNVNFIEKRYNDLFVRTYERGVEDETYSCGTGVTAAALVASLRNVATADDYCDVQTIGGPLTVNFQKQPDNSFRDIWLTGPAQFVFRGEFFL